jgi:hypothetical protein
MNKILLGSGLILGIGAIALGITNPDEQAYREFAATQLSLQLREQGCAKIPKSLGNFLQRQCEGVIEQMRPDLGKIIAENTQRKNFLLFSFYVTDLTLPTPLPSYHFETLASLNHFWVLKAEEQKSSN